MNINIIHEIESESLIGGTMLVNGQFMNVRSFKFHFIDEEDKIDIPCLTVLLSDNSETTIKNVISAESF
jgi:hypothetical protein